MIYMTCQLVFITILQIYSNLYVDFLDIVFIKLYFDFGLSYSFGPQTMW